MLLTYRTLEGVDLLTCPESVPPARGATVTLCPPGEAPQCYRVVGHDWQYQLKPGLIYYGLANGSRLTVYVLLEPC